MEPVVTSVEERETEEFPWGSITWLVSGQIGNSESMTFGRVVIRSGHVNQGHRHANCDEILHLLRGELRHTADEDIFHLRAGDTITLPAGTSHRAECVSEDDAVMVVAYSSPKRGMVPE